jgi:hypothetical protein
VLRCYGNFGGKRELLLSIDKLKSFWNILIKIKAGTFSRGMDPGYFSSG